MKTLKAKIKVIKKITKPKSIPSKEELPVKKQVNYFTIKELCYSSTAEKYNIDNTPDEEITKNLKELIAFLNPLREKWGSEIHVNSGYRNPKTNKKVGGTSTSSHCTGFAVDIRPKKGTVKELYEFMVKYLENKDYDECFIEKNRSATWVHFALKSIKGLQRKKHGALYV